MDKKNSIGTLIGITVMAIAIIMPFLDIFGIKLPKVAVAICLVFVVGVLIYMFGAGFGVNFNVRTWKGILFFISYFILLLVSLKISDASSSLGILFFVGSNLIVMVAIIKK